MSPWGWQPQRTQGIWRHGAGWLRPFFSAVPYLTVGLLLLMFHLVGGTLVSEKGLMVDLPEGGRADGATTDLVALVMTMKHETLVFFDDSRYLLGDAASMAAFREQLSERASRAEGQPLLMLVDRKVSGGDLMKLSGIARMSGVKRVLLAEKETENAE